MSKKITLNDIKKDNKKFSEKVKVPLSETHHAEIYPHFSSVKITELIKEMVTDSERAKKAGIDFDKINLSDWGLYNIIYKFSDLGIPSDIEKKVETFHLLIEWDYFGKLIESFPQESIDKFNNHLNNFNKNIEAIVKQNQLNK